MIDQKLTRLLLISSILILISGVIAFQMKKKNNPELTLQEFLNLNMKYINTPQGMKTMAVGMAGGIIFGFIDNAGLWFGMDALEDFFSKNNITGNTAAGLGNTFSDGLGAFLGTFVGIIVSEMSQVDLNDAPIWANAIGVILGCILGVLFGRSFSK